MRIKALLILIFAISSLLINGQNKIQGYVLDKHTNKPLSYAIVSEVHQKYGSYSDTTGLFTLFYLSNDDSLKVSNLGYNSINICTRDLLKSEKILLEANPLLLGEVIVNPKEKKLRKMEVGFFTKKTNIVFATVYPLNITAVFIPCPEDTGILFINAIKIIYQTTSVGDSPLRIRLLESNQNGDPGNDLVIQNLIIRKLKSGKKQVADIDISNANIKMPEDGVFIVFEWIRDKSYAKTNVKEGIPGPYIGAVKSNTSTSHWINSLNSSKWIKVPSKSALSVGLIVVDYSK